MVDWVNRVSWVNCKRANTTALYIPTKCQNGREVARANGSAGVGCEELTVSKPCQKQLDYNGDVARNDPTIDARRGFPNWSFRAYPIDTVIYHEKTSELAPWRP